MSLGSSGSWSRPMSGGKGLVDRLKTGHPMEQRRQGESPGRSRKQGLTYGPSAHSARVDAGGVVDTLITPVAIQKAIFWATKSQVVIAKHAKTTKAFKNK